MKEEFDVLVTDSRYKHSLAAVRALGRKELKVAIMSDSFSPTVFSRYSKKNFRYKKGKFIKKLLEIIKENKIRVILPIGYHSNILCSKNKNKILKYSKILIVNYEKMKIASNKEKSYEFAKKEGIPIPRTYIIKKEKDIEKIKISEMIIKSTEEMKGKKIEYIETKEELKKKIKERLKQSPQIIQENIKGAGCGFFALYVNGKLKASFLHKRINQYPATGGVSSLSSSYYNKDLYNLGKKILDKLKWNGVVMVEFILDKKEKKFKLIEINPKFWGSLDLAIESGVNFPYLTYLATIKKKFKTPKYKKEIKFQWVLPEDTIRLKTVHGKKKEIKKYFRNLFNPKIKKDIGYIFIDPFPTIIRMFGTVYKFIFEK